MSIHSISRRLIAPFMALLLTASVAQAGNESGAAKPLGKQLLGEHAWLMLPGQQDHAGNTRFMPLPAGTFDPMADVYVGEESVTLRPNEGFFLPMLYWFGEKYADGSADDPTFPSQADFFTSNVLLTLDGDTLVDSAEGLDDSYIPTTYYPKPLTYDAPSSYGSVSTYFVTGLAASHGPLSPGTHELHLVITGSWIQAVTGFSGWDNTWHLTVEK